jgi:Type I phosphodiesterase / nucleotide pyrophosphatase
VQPEPDPPPAAEGHPQDPSARRWAVRARTRAFAALALFLPGALAGAHVAVLLFFLNPHLPFTFGPVLRALLLYGGLLGLLGSLLTLPALRRRRVKAARLLPWTLTGALSLAALLLWTHASYFAYFLPAGINDRLIKAALWLSVAALICFYTALLHSLHRRRYGRRSRLAFGVLAGLSLVTAVERRHAFEPPAMPAGRPPARSISADDRRPRLLVVGLGGATLDALLPLAAEGRLPFLATALRDGAYGRLATLSPHRPDALWTTLATGKFPSKHGVTGSALYAADFLERGAELRLLPVGIGFRGWGTLGARRREPAVPDRRAAALWELLPRLGMPAGVIGWPASIPPPGSAMESALGSAIESTIEPTAGFDRGAAFLLADTFFKQQLAPRRGSRNGDLRTALPPRAAESARRLAVSPRDLDPQELDDFGPALDGRVREALAGDHWRESLALSLPEQFPRTEALFLVLPGLEGVARRSFGGFAAVEFEGAKARELQEAARLLGAYYQHLDRVLGELWERWKGEGEGEGQGQGPCLLALVSAHGVGELGAWRRLQGEMSRRAAVEGEVAGAPDGILVLYGEGVRPGTLVTGAAIADLAPTLLYGLGFPVARDLDGKVLTAAFDRRFLARHPLTFLPSYENRQVPN